jgi:hypothetical protein
VSTRLWERLEGRLLFDILREGDTLVGRWVDRLGRNFSFPPARAIRAALRYIEALEKELGRPVLTANQVVSWHGLRLSVATTPVSGCGRIFDCDRIELVGIRMEP